VAIRAMRGSVGSGYACRVMTRSARHARQASAAIALALLVAGTPAGPARAEDPASNPAGSVAQQAGAAEVAAPVLTPGDTFRFRQGDRTYLVRDVGWEGDVFLSLVEFEDGRTYRDYYTEQLNMVASEQVGSPERITHAPDSMKYRFPMHVGLTWSGHFETVVRTTSGTVTQHYSTALDCEVRCLERVDVPAGIFEAFRIECARKQSDLHYQERSTYWYAPEAGVSVLAEHVRRDMPGLVDRQELIAFDRAARAPFSALPPGVDSTCDFRVAAK